MPGPLAAVASRLQPAFDAVEPGADPVVRPGRNGADVAVNGAIALARRAGVAPAEMAARIVGSVDLADLCETIDVAPQGFVNLRLAVPYLTEALRSVALDPRSGIEAVAQPRTVVVDYSSPNVAKEMHAGHVRTTIIGDALCRMLTLVGHRVIRENHVGDWGTPFGMLIEHLVDVGESSGARALSMGDLDGFYREARASFDGSAQFADRSRRRVVALQAGDPDTLRLWRVLVDQSIAYFTEVYERLGVQLTAADVVGESFYNDLLPTVVSDLDSSGMLVDSDGARCVFPDGFTNREGEPLPLIVQKSDGGFGYAATDLAALRDRFSRLHADVAVYVVGAPQAQHFAMCFAVAQAAGWIPEGAEAHHVAFGNMLGSDRKMFRSREGDAVKLIDLVDEAVVRAGAAIADKNPDLDESERSDVARMIGVGALKYADLSTDRTRDYVFDWDRMLAFDGNTAPYLQYAHVRCRSIFRRAEMESAPYAAGEVAVTVGEEPERALAIALLNFGTALLAALDTWSPHKLCSYLFDLAGTFTTFFETCPVLKAEPSIRESRLALCAITAEVLAAGLAVLGIEAPERM
ncbi:MAG: arginine--tRNA ligase [Actinomycetota bacterium]|nr:arginine--tRNA ligase [Actinomycetota bacterium]